MEIEYIGGYNHLEREKEILQKLEDLFSKISASEIYERIKAEPEKSGTTKVKAKNTANDYDDLYNTSLEGLEKNITKLKGKIDQFRSPELHFTKEYRTLIGYCGRYQTDLDKIDVRGDEEIRRRRKECLIFLDDLQDILAARVHPDGMICPKCEITE